ncbi:MAG: ATP-binding protein [Chlamydiales bacterium]
MSLVLTLALFGVAILLLLWSQLSSKKVDRDSERILEYLEEGVVSVDSGLKICKMNYRASKILDLNKRALIGQKVTSFTGHPVMEKAKELLARCMPNEEILTGSVSLEKHDFDLIAIPQGKNRGAILILQDKSAHAQILQMGKDFIGNAAHELRTPITVIKGFAETLQDMPELPKEMVSEIMEKIVKNCERMNILVKNLLTLADLENLPALRLQNVDLNALIENCRHLLLTAHPSVKIQLHKTETPLMIRVDPDILELALMNLLENAVKYSQAPGEIMVKIRGDSEKTTIEISDKGIGIPAENLEKIFLRFYTVDKARSRRLGGAGLGLSIVKAIIEKHEGEISAASELGLGTTFTIHLPHLA